MDDLAEVARRLYVLLEPDGSIRVQGIPATWTEEARQAVARMVADATVAHLERIARTEGRTTRDDRRLLTKVAREAVAGDARRRSSRTVPSAISRSDCT